MSIALSGVPAKKNSACLPSVADGVAKYDYDGLPWGDETRTAHDEAELDK